MCLCVLYDYTVYVQVVGSVVLFQKGSKLPKSKKAQLAQKGVLFKRDMVLDKTLACATVEIKIKHGI